MSLKVHVDGKPVFLAVKTPYYCKSETKPPRMLCYTYAFYIRCTAESVTLTYSPGTYIELVASVFLVKLSAY
jgi:hypothetical protein